VATRLYQNDYPSVTQALGTLRKVGLEMWFKWNTAKFCDEKLARGKLIGTQIHEAIQKYILGIKASVSTEYPEEVTNALNSFILFRKENPLFTFEFSEIPMTSEIWKCNGTMDAVVKREGILIPTDWKTSEAKKKDKPDIYDESLAQVSAYLKFHNEVFKTNYENAIVVCFAKDKVAYNKFELSKDVVDDYFNDMFLPSLKILNHQKKYKGVLNG
jgi:hypothetical protein